MIAHVQNVQQMIFKKSTDGSKRLILGDVTALMGKKSRAYGIRTQEDGVSQGQTNKVLA